MQPSVLVLLLTQHTQSYLRHYPHFEERSVLCTPALAEPGGEGGVVVRREGIDRGIARKDVKTVVGDIYVFGVICQLLV